MENARAIMTKQLTLGLKLQDDATFINFFPGNNALVIKTLQQIIMGQGEKFVFLSGSTASGKSHLLQACCHELFKQNKKAIYISLSHPEISPSILDELEKVDLVCLDDVDKGVGAWEEAIFHFYNRSLETRNRLLVAAKLLPQQLSMQLADLKSRFSAGLNLRLENLSEQQVILALQMRARVRGFLFPREAAEYLLRRVPRDMATVLNILDQLDHASFTLQHRVTIPFIKQVLQLRES